MGYRRLCKRKRREESERCERKTLEAKRERDIWEVINRERRRIPMN